MLFCDVSIPCQMVSVVVVPLTLAYNVSSIHACCAYSAFYYSMHFIESTMWLFHRLRCNVAGITMT